MSNFLINGFMLGLAYVAPIGMQNLYVINTALGKDKMRAYQVALIVILFDISLALACFFGMGLLLEMSGILRSLVYLIGSLAVIYIGTMLVRSKPDAGGETDTDKTLLQVTSACFAVTWLNPQAIIDGSLLLGGFRASLPIEASHVFILGVCMASFAWFTGLATIVSVFKSSFSNSVVRWINVVCGAVIIYYGLKLGHNFMNEMM
ncbi:MAG: LysE family transporter [Peptoclostridium sp.]|uniref:LysE/ArgO family amino acid transporter n=1 Tax=Peptoclostridium sp. TaxID=1904860 RepID=UPI00139E902E|nr:LysE family transporter [Peptoclostridium sp.]MZQ74719.1 LysE family transporter [Peptoclostridium sp.]